MKKKNFLNNKLWWLDSYIMNTNIKFKYSQISNIYKINISSNFFFFFFLINKKNINNLLISNLDGVIVKNLDLKKYYISLQSFFFDFKILIDISFTNYINSISLIYSGNSWLERELKEFNNVNFINLNDSRKLLLNYNYNNDLTYNNFNNIINDIKI